MVVFLCDGCNATLKRSQVDVHAQRCRKCVSVSCVDCSVSFYEDDYLHHTSCITEAEKYEKTSNKQKPLKKNPQDEWNKMIEKSISSAPESLRSMFTQLFQLGNAPRKEKQFRNFTSNSLKIRDFKIVDQMWSHLVKFRDDERAKREREVNEKKVDDISGKEHKGKEMDTNTKHSLDVDTSKSNVERSESTTCNLDCRKIKKVMKRTLKKVRDNKLKFKDLRRVVREKIAFEGSREDLKKICLDQIERDKSMEMNGKMTSLLC